MKKKADYLKCPRCGGKIKFVNEKDKNLYWCDGCGSEVMGGDKAVDDLIKNFVFVEYDSIGRCPVEMITEIEKVTVEKELGRIYFIEGVKVGLAIFEDKFEEFKREVESIAEKTGYSSNGIKILKKKSE